MFRVALTRFSFWLFRRLLSLRYRIEFKGLRAKEIKRLRKKGGVLFLPNHPALIDPLIIVSRVWRHWRTRPMVVETTYFFPVIHAFFKRFLRAVRVPNFQHASNSYKLMRAERALQEVLQGVKRGENFLIYPAGRLKRTPEEFLGGASAVYDILQRAPEVPIVLVRTTGLWGSTFSWGIDGKQPYLRYAFKHGFLVLLKNLIFLTPRRKVTIEFQLAPQEFPRWGTRSQLNNWLESWYNRPRGPFQTEGDPLTLVSFSRWKVDLPEVTYQRPVQTADIKNVPLEIRRRVLREVSRLSKHKTSEIQANMHLYTDLGLDSLDIAELVSTFDRERALTSGTHYDLLTVGALMAIAADQFTVLEEEQKLPSLDRWRAKDERPPADFPQGDTLIEAFLHCCDRMGDAVSCADDAAGTFTFSELKVRVIILAQEFQKLPNQRIGVMFPASIAAQVVVLAALLAGKVPVMVNWTVGVRFLRAMREIAEIDHVITSSQFLDRLEAADITPIHALLITLESIKARLTWRNKLQAKRLAERSVPEILKHFGADKLCGEDHAAVLFTSGTEAAPKGVPLSHTNILTNQCAAISMVQFEQTDAMVSILPPFHSLGFTVTSLIPMVTGARVVYFAAPTDSAGLANAIERYRPTIMCVAPTFLRGLFSAGTKEQLQSLRLFIVGAEKAPLQLFDQVQTLNDQAVLIEGYGVTECSPILTINRPWEMPQGVGKPIEGVELKIVSPDHYQPLPQGDVGLIIARGTGVFKGYLGWNVKRPFVAFDGKEWYDTGDLGHFDDEGSLHLTGRLKRFVKIGGEMIGLPVMEMALERAAKEKKWGNTVPTKTLAVVGTDIEGRRPVLYLFANYFIDRDAANQALKEKGFSNLARIGVFHQLKEMPLMGTGKCNYLALQELAHELEGE